MRTPPEWSILVLGAVVSYLAMVLIARLKAYTAASMCAFLAVLLTGVALTFATENIEKAGGEPNDIWLYPFGYLRA